MKTANSPRFSCAKRVAISNPNPVIALNRSGPPETVQSTMTSTTSASKSRAHQSWKFGDPNPARLWATPGLKTPDSTEA